MVIPFVSCLDLDGFWIIFEKRWMSTYEWLMIGSWYIWNGLWEGKGVGSGRDGNTEEKAMFDSDCIKFETLERWC